MSMKVGKTYIFDNPCHKDCSLVIIFYVYADTSFKWCSQVYFLKSPSTNRVISDLSLNFQEIYHVNLKFR